MNYIGQYNSISSWEKKDKEDIENMSLAKRARYYQSLIKDRRLEKTPKKEPSFLKIFKVFS